MAVTRQLIVPAHALPHADRLWRAALAAEQARLTALPDGTSPGPSFPVPRPCTPTSSSWMNLVNRFSLPVRRNAGGEFRQRTAVDAGPHGVHGGRNKRPQPDRWQADGVEILAKIQRAREVEKQGFLLVASPPKARG